jgi:hypothetical protein
LAIVDSASDGGARVAAARLPQRSERRLALLLALLALLVYNSNLRSIPSGDTFPARYLPFALWQHGSLYLDSVLQASGQGRTSDLYWIVPLPGDRHASQYPVVTPLVAAPLYLPAVAYLEARGTNLIRLWRLGEVMDKLAASAIASLAVGLLYLLLSRRVRRREAVLLTVAFAFGTSTWVIGSQTLWQQGTAELLAVLLLLAVTGEPTPARIAAAGALCGLLVANRPFDALLALGIGVYALVWARRRAPLLLLAAAVPLALLLAYNLTVFGLAGGGYEWVVRNSHPADQFAQPLLTGLADVLASPYKGLFVYSPFLLVLTFALARRGLGEGRERLLGLCLLGAVVLQTALYAKATHWEGGSCYGPRFLTSMLPLLVWLLAPALATLRGWERDVFAAGLAFAIYAQAVGAFFYPQGASDMVSAAWAWSLPRAPYFQELRGGPAPMTWLHAGYVRLN